MLVPDQFLVHRDDGFWSRWAGAQIVEATRDSFQDLYNKGLTQHDHSAFLLHLEDMSAPVRLGTGADTVPE